jgi:hypothetical protein
MSISYFPKCGSDAHEAPTLSPDQMFAYLIHSIFIFHGLTYSIQYICRSWTGTPVKIGIKYLVRLEWND